MRQNASTNEFAKRMSERPIPPSLTEPYHNDPPARISQAFGGRNWFFETEARAIHRIGTFLGLGWRLPKYIQRPDGIDMVKIFTSSSLAFKPDAGFTMEFLHCGDRPPEEAEQVQVYYQIPLGQLRQFYEKVLNG